VSSCKLEVIKLSLSRNAAAAVGTVSVRSLIEPIRKIVARVRGHFVLGKAIDLVMSERLLEVETLNSDGSKNNFYIPFVSVLSLTTLLSRT